MQEFDVFFYQHPAVIRETKDSGSDWVKDGRIIWQDGGFVLYGFQKYDIYMLRTPDSMWKRAYIGQNDDAFNKEVHEKKYGLKAICSVKLEGFGDLGDIFPIYI